MQPPIAIGTLLQNRYRLVNILGQGGFGRTYLVEDLGRFQERCALKELIPVQSGPYVLEKSKELFQREAAILYQIGHPQIPQFRAIFEENQRLFLVQDYVEGMTYRELLLDRTSNGRTFTEAEVLEILEAINAYFPAAQLEPSDVISAWAGLRPLISDGASKSTTAVSREEEIFEGRDGLLSIAGGKLTTYRLMAERIVTRAAWCAHVRGAV